MVTLSQLSVIHMWFRFYRCEMARLVWSNCQMNPEIFRDCYEYHQQWIFQALYISLYNNTNDIPFITIVWTDMKPNQERSNGKNEIFPQFSLFHSRIDGIPELHSVRLMRHSHIHTRQTFFIVLIRNNSTADNPKHFALFVCLHTFRCCIYACVAHHSRKSISNSDVLVSFRRYRVR